MSEPIDIYPLQTAGIDWLADTRRTTKYLGDDCGTGKSVQDIKGADKAGFDHIQVICPAMAVEDWYRKFIRFSDYGRYIVKAFNDAPVPPASLPRKSVLINGITTAVNHRKLYKANRYGGLLLVDEVHNFKNPATLRARALYGANCAGFGGISQNYEAVWVNSGTPTPNGDPRELWPHLHALRPYSILDADGHPMSYNTFADYFCKFKPGLGGDKVVGIRHPEELMALLGGSMEERFMLRRLAAAFGLPDVRFEIYPISPARVPRELDRAQWPELSGALDLIIDAASEGDLETQLEEQLATLRRMTGLLKVEATCNLVAEELREGIVDNAVIFAYSTDVVNEIAKRLSKFGGCAITGSTPMKKRWEYVDQFNSGARKVWVGQILASNTNTSIEGCTNVLFAETDWVGDNNYQAANRCRRIDGHKQPVLARIISISGTIDEPMQLAARRKTRQSRQILPTV